MDIRAVLSGEPAVLKVTLFGSRAMGRQKTGSDIDLYIHTQGSAQNVISKLETALDDLLLPWSFDLVHDSTLTDPELLDHIRRVGITVYQAA
jgi:predicted nucleotidyltransferase